jgi:sterol desaturase/sphingolipid hydroxylase (fatty acid hydroxylase superfamily)
MSYLGWSVPQPMRWAMVLCVSAGVAMWSVMAHVRHRFVLHEFPVLRMWHQSHQACPWALICTPTFLSATLIAALVHLPLYLALDRWFAMGITLGVLLGYVGDALKHHAIHHWRAESTWLAGRRRWHALHHRANQRAACFGVTSTIWDRLLFSQRFGGSAQRPCEGKCAQRPHGPEGPT